MMDYDRQLQNQLLTVATLLVGLDAGGLLTWQGGFVGVVVSGFAIWRGPMTLRGPRR